MAIKTNLGSKWGHGSMNSTSNPHISQGMNVRSCPIVNRAILGRLKNLIFNGGCFRGAPRSHIVIEYLIYRIGTVDFESIGGGDVDEGE